MDRPRRVTPKKSDATEMIGLLPEEEAALRKALLASMQSEKAINKKPSPLPPSKKGCKRGARKGKGKCKRPRGQREQTECLDNFEVRCESRFPEDSKQFNSSSPFTEPDGVTMGQDLPEQSSDSDSDFSAEKLMSWTPGKKELSYNQIQSQEPASMESDLSSCETPDFQLTLSQSDSVTPNDASSPLTTDNNRHCYQSIESKLTSSRYLYHAQKNMSHQLPCQQLGRQNQSDILQTEVFLSFLCMRNENEQLPGLLQHFRVNKVRGVTRGLSQCRKRKPIDQKKKHSVAKKLVFYKQTDV